VALATHFSYARTARKYSARRWADSRSGSVDLPEREAWRRSAKAGLGEEEERR
jgi:hypothetical protein